MKWKYWLPNPGEHVFWKSLYGALCFINKQLGRGVGHESHYSLEGTGSGQPSILSPYSTLYWSSESPHKSGCTHFTITKAACTWDSMSLSVFLVGIDSIARCVVKSGHNGILLLYGTWLGGAFPEGYNYFWYNYSIPTFIASCYGILWCT